MHHDLMACRDWDSAPPSPEAARPPPNTPQGADTSTIDQRLPPATAASHFPGHGCVDHRPAHLFMPRSAHLFRLCNHQPTPPHIPPTQSGRGQQKRKSGYSPRRNPGLSWCGSRARQEGPQPSLRRSPHPSAQPAPQPPLPTPERTRRRDITANRADRAGGPHHHRAGHHANAAPPPRPPPEPPAGWRHQETSHRDASRTRTPTPRPRPAPRRAITTVRTLPRPERSLRGVPGAPALRTPEPRPGWRRPSRTALRAAPPASIASRRAFVVRQARVRQRGEQYRRLFLDPSGRGAAHHWHRGAFLLTTPTACPSGPASDHHPGRGGAGGHTSARVS